ncbi:MAG: NERD domain-containing protein, partial [Nitrososphaerales archaeon]
MARIIPSDISRLALGQAHSAELDTLDALKQDLPDDYMVFHSVHWSLENGKKNQFGEIDFVVVNGSGKAVVIEQKNGALEETEWGLVKRYGEDGKSVGGQVHRSLDAIRDKFRRHNGPKNKFSLDYLIYCPDHKIENLNAPGLDATRIVDARERDRLGARVEKLFELGDSQNKEHAKAVRDFFCQSFEVVPDVHAYLDAQQRSYTRLSGGLVSLIDNLEMSPFRLRVHGTAGCGKSLAARHFFDKAIAQGKRPLLVCVNRPLSERLKANVREGGTVYTLYGLYDTFLKEMGHQLDYAQMNEDPSFWKKAAELVVASAVPEQWQFDGVIVDEGQDFGAESYEMLRCFMKDNADVLWLEDPTQNLRQTSAVSGDDFIIYNAKENYRTTRNISRFIEKTMPFEFECT